jgi:hypothetical protein
MSEPRNPEPPGRVRIISRKWDGTLHRDSHARDLDIDEHGRWLELALASGL